MRGGEGEETDGGTVDSGATDSVLQALAFAPIARDLAPGAMLGDSLQIIRRIGAGGMGVVYLAFDRQLERELVVKVHRGDHDPARLAREAIAMARVQHPNVVTVYDVGRLDAQVYVAMEYVAGETLRTWIDPSRGWRATTAMMRAIGDGLAAAHDAGLVHRDFKPENVLIGTDGRPRVSDFGLARLATAPDERGGGGIAPPGLTSAGAIVGTLGYMSSEQLACGPVDARSDQFAFCVVLFEALFGVRPFAGATRAQLAGAIARGEVRPMHGRVPGRLRAAVLRGLAAERARRFPSMRALLRELDRALARRRIVAAGAAAVAIAGIAAGAMWLTRPAVEAPEDVCATAGEYVTGLWNPAVAARNAILYHERDAQYGPGVVADISRNLGTFARDLRATSRRVCLGRHAAPAWSPTVQERAERCLAFYDNTLLDIVHDTRPEQVARIEGALRVGRNGTPVICADPAEMARRTLLPSGPQLAQLTQLMDRAATAYMQASTISEDVIVGLEREAEAMRAGPGIVAFVALARGGFERARGQPAAAITAYEHAYYGAAATGDSETVLNAAIQLVDLLGIDGGDASRAIPYLRQLHAIAILRPDLAPIAYQVIGATATARGDLPGAIAYLTRAKQLAEDADGSGTLAYAQTLFSLAIAYELGGRARDAVPLIERAIAVRAAVLGVDAPELAADHYDLGLLLISVGEIDRATREVEHAAAIDARWPERRPPIERATGLLDHGAVLAAGARYDEAVELETQALLGFAAAEGEDSLDVALALSTLASAHIGQGDYRRAAAAIGEALAIYERRHPDSLDVASALAVSGKIQVDLGRCERARPMLRRALRLFRTVEPTGVRWTTAISGLAGCALEAGRPTEMLPELAEADHALHAFPLEPFGADVLFAYARSLGAARRDPALARARALEARAVYAGLGELGRARLAAVDRWLAHR